MKITIVFKDPDGVSEAVDESVKEFISTTGLSEEESADVKIMRTQTIHDRLKQWIDYQEYVSIEFDLLTMTAKVLNAKQS